MKEIMEIILTPNWSADILAAKLVDKSNLKFMGAPPKREFISFVCKVENWLTQSIQEMQEI